MNAYIERTCTVIGDENEKEVSLADFRDRDAYVLLGGPGIGKTRSFKEEAERTKGEYVEAHDFIDFDQPRDKTLFIDGLDELRASSPSPEPLGLIRAKLDKLGRPRFRLSCRDADWSSALDADDLAKVSRDGRVAKLKLAPLSDGEVGKFLAALNVDEEAFADQAYKDGNAPLLRNPLSLEHLVRAVEDGQQPRSRKEAFEASCRSLLREHNRKHARARENVPFGVEEQLDAAAHLCAVALLAGKRGYVRSPAESDARWVTVGEVPGNHDLFNAVFRTRLFEATDDRFAPPHHHIAEFLAGRHLAKRVEDGLPPSRAIALMTGFDGGVVAALRGVWAWFAAHCAVARAELIDADPFATVLYGDVKHFSVADKQRLLDGTRSRGDELFDLPYDSWSSPRWADVATDDAAFLIRDVFSRAPDSEHGQRVALLLSDVPERRTFSDLWSLLLSIVRNEGLWNATRRTALRRLIGQFQGVQALEDELSSLLSDIAAGRLADRDDELAGRLLCELYPHRVSLAASKALFHTPKEPTLVGRYHHFWTTAVRKKALQSEKVEARRLAAEFKCLAKQAFLDDGVASPGNTP